jgi:nucleotide-binding universal stress UspA family protein
MRAWRKESASIALRQSLMIKIERILCPTEFTFASDEALRYAVALAHEYRAKLLLCHCAPHLAGHGNQPATAQHMRRLCADALMPHMGLLRLCELDWGVLSLSGDEPGAAITSAAAAQRVDLIVLRSRRRPHASALLGSTAETICRTAPCSVLVTHPREREWVGCSTGEIDLARVLVAHDFSDRSELGLQYGLSLVEKFDAELHLLHVLPEQARASWELAWAQGTGQNGYHTAMHRLEAAVPAGSPLRRKVQCEVREGRPYNEALAYSTEHEIDLICMGADGVDRSLHALFGSNVDRVLRQAPCPVLVARAFKPLPTATDQSCLDRWT